MPSKKRDVHNSKPPLLPIATSGPWEVIAANCMCPLPATNLGNWYVLIIGDLFTKYIETAALHSIETTIITLVFLDKIVLLYHLTDFWLTMEQILHQSLWHNFAMIFNINKVFTWSYHPQFDGFVEQINEVIMQITAMYVATDQKDWDA